MDFADDIDPFATPAPETPADPRRIGLAIQLAFSRCFPGLLGAFLLVMALNLLIMQSPNWLIAIGTGLCFDLEMYDVGAIVSMGSLCCLLPQIILALVIGAISTGLYRVIRVAIVEGPHAVGGIFGALKIAISRFIYIVPFSIVGGILVGLSALLCCFPIFITGFFFVILLYVVAATDEDWVGIPTRTFNLVMRNPLPLIGSYVILIVVSVIVGCAGGIFGGVGAAIGGGLASISATVGNLVGQACVPACSSILTSLITFPLFLTWGAVLVAVETSDSGVALCE